MISSRTNERVHVRVCTCIFNPHSNLQEVMNKLFDQQSFSPAQDNLGNAQEHKNTRIHPDSQKKIDIDVLLKPYTGIIEAL